MTDQSNPQLPHDLLALLGDDAVWAELDPDVVDDAVAAVMAEACRAPSTIVHIEDERPTAPVLDFDARRRPQWSSALLGAAAAMLLAVAGFVVLNLVADDGGPSSDFAVALAPTELQPGASGRVELTARPDGTVIVIETTGLPPAPEGTYYEAWLRTGPEFGVSPGTFHLRGGGGCPSSSGRACRWSTSRCSR
jgi:hypothetical protein